MASPRQDPHQDNDYHNYLDLYHLSLDNLHFYLLNLLIFDNNLPPVTPGLSTNNGFPTASTVTHAQTYLGKVWKVEAKSDPGQTPGTIQCLHYPPSYYLPKDAMQADNVASAASRL